MKKRLVNVNDYHKALWDWEDLKEVMADVEKEFLKFYGPKKIKIAGTRARRKMLKMINMIYGIRKKALMQRQDYDSEY